MKLILTLLAIIILTATAQAESKPNILFIAIDDMNDWTGFLGGHPQAKTPNMDALAKRGVNFTNAHCPAPGCSPSRNALLYGVEPFHSGLYAFYEHDLHPDLLKQYGSLPQFLKDNGYDTFGAGKIHHGSKSEPQEWSDYHEPTKSPLNLNVAAGYQVDNQFKMSFCPTTAPLEDHPDHKVASYGIDVLARKHDKPFFLAVGIVKPHLPFVCPQQFFDLYPDPVDPPQINPDDLDDIPRVGRSMAKLRDDNRFKKDQAWDKVRRAYLACISWADFNVGRVLDALEASPYADNTIVVLWSDHGYALGEKNHFRKFALWEETTRVPFIIWDTREQDAPSDREVTAGVSVINIYRTLAELTDLTPPTKVDGFSLVPQLKNPLAPLPSPAICTWGRGNYTVRDRDFRYTRYFDGGEELYSHAKDPNEWANVADNPEFATVKKRLAAYLPKQEAPLVEKGITAVRATMSADKSKSKNK
ncbi:sulfatase [Novipirellula sp. SH528]|uniref:sulfatase n=1 Tax=Novipirellula sp. SH528 TaxID=3454466 RepID=UPI003FA0298B